MLNYLIFRIFIESFRLIPFRLLYIISDIGSFILFKLFKYRKKAIYENLTMAFPEKSKSEIRKIANKFYPNFMDVLLEGLKGMTMSTKSVLKRHKLLNPEILEPYFEQGKNILCLGAHYSNWEWGVSIDMHMKHDSVTVYKAVKNQRINKFIRESRSRWGMKQISMEKTRTIFYNIEKPKFIILIADQSPSLTHLAIWVDFLGRDTPCIHGPEAYGLKFNYPVIFLDFQRVKRGHYTTELSLLAEEPASLEKNEITKKYMAMLEEVIRKKPEDWLWTHKRWKHKREGDKILTDYYYK